MDALMDFLYLAGIGMVLSYMCMVIYVSIWEGDDDDD